MIRADLDALVKGKGWSVLGRRASLIKKGTDNAVRFDEGAEGGLAIWISGEEFINGTIECKLRGNTIHQKSFLGIAFHGANENEFELVYFRPFNFKSEAPERRAHAVQYCSLPAYSWRRLRTENSGKYEKSVRPIPDPDSWFQVRIVVEYPHVSVFVNDAKEPCLNVDQLSDRKKGWVGLWVGPNSGGEFAALEISGTVHTPTLIVL